MTLINLISNLDNITVKKKSDLWKRVTIGSLCLGIFDGPHATPKPSSEGAVYLGIKNITEDGKLDLSEIRYIAEKDFVTWIKRAQPLQGDIVFSYEATLNRYAIIPKGFRGCLGRRLAVIKTNPVKIDNRFLFYYFFSEDWRRTISKNLLSGSTVDRIPITTFPDFEVSIPPLPTQHKIASILSAYDDLIENNTRRIKILEEMAQMLYREWFVNFRFPNHENVKMVESELGLIPEGWEITKLGNHITTQKGYAFKSEWYQDYGVPIVKVSNFTDDSIDITNLVSISEEIAQQYKKYELKSNEIIIQTVGSWASNPQSVVGKVIRTPRQAEGALLNQNAVKIFPQNSINLAFLFHCLKREEFKSYIVGCGQGAASQASITLDAIKAFKTLLPSSNLLKLFKETIYPNWELINNLRVKNINLSKTRDLLLPKLISGKIDVENLDIETLEIAA